MKRLLAAAVVGMMASSANAAVLGIRTPDGNLHGQADPLELTISATAEIQITLDMYDYETTSGIWPTYPENVYGASIFLDTVQMIDPLPPDGDLADEGVINYDESIFTPLQPPSAGNENLELLDVTRAGDPDFIWNVRSFMGGEMGVLEFGPLPPGSGLDLEWYQLNASMNSPPDPALPPLTNPGDGTGVPNRYILDTLVIHCTDVSIDTIWFENENTFQAPFSPVARAPWVLKDTGYGSLAVTDALEGFAWGMLGFDNAFIKTDGTAKTNFARDGFWVVQTPEPASFTLLALVGLAVIRQRR